MEQISIVGLEGHRAGDEAVLMPRRGSEEPEGGEDGEDGDDEEPLPDRRRAALVLLLVLLLVAGGLVLVHLLRNLSQIQDCALSGRTNCAPITSSGQ